MEKDLSQKNIFFQKNTLCHSFRIIVIPSVLLSFLPDYCHSFRITVIPSVLVSFLPNIVIPSELLPSQILVILNSSCTLPYLKGEIIGRESRPYLRVFLKNHRPVVVMRLFNFFCNFLGDVIYEFPLR